MHFDRKNATRGLKDKEKVELFSTPEVQFIVRNASDNFLLTSLVPECLLDKSPLIFLTGMTFLNHA